jgi:hypothetical protein
LRSRTIIEGIGSVRPIGMLRQTGSKLPVTVFGK